MIHASNMLAIQTLLPYTQFFLLEEKDKTLNPPPKTTHIKYTLLK